MSDKFRIELTDAEGQLLAEIADPKMTRRQVALTYGLAVRGDQSRVDWPKVNRAIVARWSPSALDWIKKFAGPLPDHRSSRAGQVSS
jgi:hypothetical protein